MIALLQAHSLTVKDRFMPEKQALNLSERQTTTTITVGPEAPTISVGDWLKDESEPGAGIVYRVKSVENAFESETRTITCEHIINVLKDSLMFGEVKPKDITGRSTSTTCTVKQAGKYIMDQQGTSDWVLWNVGFNQSEEYTFNGDDLYSALETVTSALEDPWWSYTLSVYPFRLHINQRGPDVGCEMRMDRNLKTIKRTVDRSRMFTRLYPIGENDLHINGNYVSRNTSKYGVICKVETDTSKTTKDTLKSWATSKLYRHAQPDVTITISGLELSGATGEPLDRLTLGMKCRVPLPEYGTTIEEWITKLSWSDKIADPESVTVTLANTLEDVASIVNKLSSSSSSSSRKQATQDGEDHAWMVDTDTHVGMVAEAVAGPGAASDWSRVSSVIVDGQGIHQRVTTTERDVVTMESNLEVLEGRISAEVTNRQNADTTLSGRITVEAGRITAEVTRATTAEGTLSSRLTLTESAITAEVTRATTAEGTLSGRITVEAGKITQIVSNIGADGTVTAASIVLAINGAGESECHIDAQKVYIGNSKSTTVIAGKCELSDVTADYISGKIATLSMLNVSAISSSGNISVSNGYIMAPTIYLGSTGSAMSLSGSIWALNVKKSGSTVTIQKKDFDDSDWVDVGSFSRATSLSGTWSSGKVTVTANGDTSLADFVHVIKGGTGSRSGNLVSIEIFAYTAQDRLVGSTGRTVTHTLTTHSNCAQGLARYNNQADGKVHLYAKSGNTYYDCGEHYWYWRDTNQNLTTYYD